MSYDSKKDKAFQSYAKAQVENYAKCYDWWERHDHLQKVSIIGIIKNRKPEYEGGGETVHQFYRTMAYDGQFFQAPGIFGIPHPEGLRFYELRPGGMSYDYFNPASHSKEETREFIGSAYVSQR